MGLRGAHMSKTCKTCFRHVKTCYFYPGDWKVKNLNTVGPSKIDLFQNLPIVYHGFRKSANFSSFLSRISLYVDFLAFGLAVMRFSSDQSECEENDTFWPKNLQNHAFWKNACFWRFLGSKNLQKIRLQDTS